MYDHRMTLHKDVKEIIREKFPQLTFKTVIRSNIDLATAPSHYQSIFDYSPKSRGAIDYTEFSKEFLKRIKKGVEQWQEKEALV